MSVRATRMVPLLAEMCPRPVPTRRSTPPPKQARTEVFQHPGTLFATTLKGKVIAMCESLHAPVMGGKNHSTGGAQ